MPNNSSQEIIAECRPLFSEFTIGGALIECSLKEAELAEAETA